MTGYSWFSIFALLCYLFLFLTFISMKKSDRVIKAFIALLVIMIMWAGGSLAMRTQIWPEVNFWHHVSVFGMTLLVAGYYNFVIAFLEEKNQHGAIAWLVIHTLLFGANLFTGLFIPDPIVREANGGTQFIYEYTWHIYLFLMCIVPCLVQMISLIYRHCKGNHIVYQQLKPIITGLLIMVAGHIAATFPMFSGVPLDIMSGPVNVIFIFYALYKKRLFKMTVLFSKLNYLFFAVILCTAGAYEFASPLQTVLIEKMGMTETVSLIAIAVIFVLLVFGVYACIAMLFNHMFIRSEKLLQIRVEKFAEDINHMLNVGDILQNLTDTIQELTHLERMFVFTQQSDGDFRVEHTTNPLEDKSFYMKPDHPLLTYFRRNNKGIGLTEFSRTTVYRSMWEKEKQTLNMLSADYFVPLISENNLAGVLVLPEKKDKSPYNPADLSLIYNVCSICASSLNDANAYERAVDDARKDKLTGLINSKYFFEILESEFDKYQEASISLCLINIDDFKMYTQLYGTQTSNAALQHIAGLLISSLNETSIAARIGDKEFALILPGYDIHSAKLLTENIAAEIGTLNEHASINTPSRLTISAGICAAPYMASSAKELFQNAETAVYTVKRSGKNAVQIYSSKIYHQETPQYKYSSGYSENESTITALTAAIDAKDHYTFQHSQNVAYYATALAKAAGMENDLIEIIKESSLIHDIGKIGISEEILNKNTPLTPDEAEIMKGHVENAVNIIRHLPALEYVIPTVLSHHEYFDGTGYPKQLRGDEIPVLGRILCIADSFDAMTSSGNGKQAVSQEEAIAVLQSESGNKFDPKFVAIFIDLFEKGKLSIHNQTSLEDIAMNTLAEDINWISKGPN